MSILCAGFGIRRTGGPQDRARVFRPYVVLKSVGEIGSSDVGLGADFAGGPKANSEEFGANRRRGAGSRALASISRREGRAGERDPARRRHHACPLAREPDRGVPRNSGHIPRTSHGKEIVDEAYSVVECSSDVGPTAFSSRSAIGPVQSSHQFGARARTFVQFHGVDLAWCGAERVVSPFPTTLNLNPCNQASGRRR